MLENTINYQEIKEKNLENSDENNTLKESTTEKNETNDYSDENLDSENKIYCANCINCILLKKSTGKSEEYVLRVKCSSKQWKKKLGEEKVYKFFTVARRTVESCGLYESMGDLKSYLKDLRKNLPIRDEVYTN